MSERGTRLRRFYADRLDSLPWWVAAAVGLVSVAVGFSITLRPFSSLGALVVLVAIAFVVVGGGELSSGGLREGAGEDSRGSRRASPWPYGRG